jgi:hypothetical protein
MNVHAFVTDTYTTLHATSMVVHAPGAGVPDTADNLADSIPTDNQRLIGVWNPYTLSRNSVRSNPLILFHKTPEQLRRIGSLGGKAHGRNHRARRALMAPPPPAPPRARAGESTIAAIAALDAQFPWLRSAEKRPRKLRR